MATHFICQATEPLPHKFPTSRAPERGHGAVSQYELLNLSDKRHCQFPPPGWNTSESSEDSLPLFQVPAPLWKTTTNLIGPDPSLCVTPEKPFAGRASSQQNQFQSVPSPLKQSSHVIDTDLDLTLTPERASDSTEHKSNLRNGMHDDGKFKGQHRVRFELDNSKGLSDSGDDSYILQKSRQMKPYQPASYSDKTNKANSCETGAVTHGKPTQYTVSVVNNQTVYVPVKGKGKGLANHFVPEDQNLEETQSKVQEIAPVLPEVIYDEQSDSRLVCHVQNPKLAELQKVNKTVKKVDKVKEVQHEKIFIKGEGDSAPKRKVKVKRENNEHPSLNNYNFPFSDGIPDTSEYEHVFNRPEYNSTLRMRTELQQIKDSHVDVSKALEKKLTLSDTKRTEITEKATSKVNTKESMFTGLVSLEIPVEDLCTNVEQSKDSKVSSKVSRPRTQTSKHSNEPDLMEFFTPELQKEQAEFSLPGLSTTSESLSTASHIRAFDLYRHNRVWENNSYFSALKK